MEDQEALKSTAAIGNTTEAIQYRVDNLLANCVVPTSVVVRRVFFTSDELLRVEELFVGAGADFV